MADDDADDPTLTPAPTSADDPVDVVDPGEPGGRVVQLERPRSRRRRGSGGGGTDPTRPAGRGVSGMAAGEFEPAGSDERSGRGPRRGRDDGEAARRHDGDDPDDAASSGEDLTADATDDTLSASSGAVLSLTTLRGRAGRGEDLGDGSAATGDGAEGPPPALHPRMRSRRIAIRRTEGLRRLRRLTWGLAGLALLVDGLALAHTGFVDVDRFDVAGSPNTSAAAVQSASGIHAGDALLTLDESGAERRIEELPWVAEADVVRQWPGTVRITVTERQPAAVLQVKDDPAVPLALADATGRILDIGAHPEGLIAVTQVPARLVEGGRVPAEARDALRIAAVASQRMPGTIVSVTVGLEATLGTGGVVLFGSVDDLDTKLMALSTVLARVDLDCLGTLNISVPDHPALERSC